MQIAENGTETIAAVSTAAGASARAIVRLSGPDALRIVRSMAGGRAHTPDPPDPTDPSDWTDRSYSAFSATLALEGLALPCRLYVMRAPASYTREDIVEIHTFGNPAVLRALMEELVRRGARPAGPGEFTRRAFLNGRIDLAQAEAVEALIRARDEDEYRAALGTLGGGLRRELEKARDELTSIASLIELSLDFSDQDVEVISVAQAVERLNAVRSALEELAARPGAGRLSRAGVSVILSGPPNAGKSSLFNRILNQSRAIVSPHPGTTRDAVEASVIAEGLDMTLVDTAGLRPAGCEVETAAVARSRESLRAADIPVCVLDGSALPDADALAALASADLSRGFILLNKSDLGPARSEWAAAIPKGAPVMFVSAATGDGLAAFMNAVRERVETGRVGRSPGGLMVSAREAAQLQRAVAALDRAAACAGEIGMELLASDVRDALAALAECSGGDVTGDVLDRIFSNFCIGK